jgi:Mg/Co/Ni transporter MgtE
MTSREMWSSSQPLLSDEVALSDKPPDHEGSRSRLKARAVLLVGLLLFQSCSSFILSSFEELLQKHSVIVFFLTMLVGAGGNAGNQAAVLVIRGLATGEISRRSRLIYLWSEAKTAFGLSILMVGVGFARVLAFQYTLTDAMAIATALFIIVLSSVVVGASLPMLLAVLGVDPSHAGATIQVIMDLAGVLITCLVCSKMLV